MPTATMTSKGQLTIPKEIRNDLGLVPGSVLTMSRTDDGNYLLTPKRHSLASLKGTVHYDGPPISVEQMDEDIATAAAESSL